MTMAEVYLYLTLLLLFFSPSYCVYVYGNQCVVLTLHIGDV